MDKGNFLDSQNVCNNYLPILIIYHFHIFEKNFGNRSVIFTEISIEARRKTRGNLGRARKGRRKGVERRQGCRHAHPTSLVSRRVPRLSSYASFCRASWHPPTRPPGHRASNSTWEKRPELLPFNPDIHVDRFHRIYGISRRDANRSTFPAGGLHRLARMTVFFFLLPFLLFIPSALRRKRSIYLCQYRLNRLR